MIRPRFARSVAAVVALVTLSSFAVACSGSSDEVVKTADGKTVLRYEGSTGQVIYPELAADLGYFNDVELNWIGDTTSGPQSIQNAATGQTEFGGAFNGAVVKLASAGSPITSVIGYYGSDKESFNGYYVLDDSPIKSAKDLIGKKVGMNTLGAHHEFVVREWLAREGGLTPDEIKQVELIVVPPVNTEQALRQGQIDVATLGSVFRDSALERGGFVSCSRTNRCSAPSPTARWCSVTTTSRRTRRRSPISCREQRGPSAGRRHTHEKKWSRS